MLNIFRKLYKGKRSILEKFIGERMSLAHAEYIKALEKRADEIDKNRYIYIYIYYDIRN
ncbi:hypothetical protein RBU49_05075 [Clostridium sp. MB40-C1]|uniref:hypothetical protein n=1 Tax=Clostridium sp. MB40-C1 TaxID=3070996 RepID=UPI0027DF598B|nr:hypothetical protein [Clostridium sp. MB40-C1]WMJ81622.1 hypothetical protein RBU49_05075 [Clostridium sp. MB40-C1]